MYWWWPSPVTAEPSTRARVKAVRDSFHGEERTVIMELVLAEPGRKPRDGEQTEQTADGSRRPHAELRRSPPVSPRNNRRKRKVTAKSGSRQRSRDIV